MKKRYELVQTLAFMHDKKLYTEWAKFYKSAMAYTIGGSIFIGMRHVDSFLRLHGATQRN